MSVACTNGPLTLAARWDALQLNEGPTGAGMTMTETTRPAAVPADEALLSRSDDLQDFDRAFRMFHEIVTEQRRKGRSVRSW